MTTSNKLLLGFAGVLVLFMLFSVIILKADYNKGITNIERQQPQVDPDYTKTTLPAFKALVLRNTSPQPADQGASFRIRESNDYAFEFYKNATFHVSGDTLYVEVSKPRDVVLFCPTISYIGNTSNYSLDLNDTKAPVLQINVGSDVGTFIYKTEINSFSYTGGNNNKLEVSDENKLDSVRIKMGKNGSLFFYAPYKSGEFKVDSLKELNLAERSIQSLKQFN
ncbi:hypothetical protein [Chitinophaga arvensicola]|uniref:Uncharacterized protein n=1 Tax=Chitinophaga arvensicola TaxID=29529 RepID=A0A1I0QAX1_9BACT|nr:hypothetical protein [Chitinophaga arvensicola]SEW23946.1 hypothetical protein SAMN04488122_1332 [Chitinophaga arvensicola]